MTQTPLDPSAIDRLHEAHDRILAQLSRVIVGQSQVIEELLICRFSRGHCLLEGVPGLAKTLAVRTLADVLHASFSRIQFTPDLLPADVVGTMIYEAQRAAFTVRQGPIFAQIVLADEINRAPAKVQSALLEAMQEKQVTIGDTTYPLTEPFIVMATQNPIDQEGTYPLPEAQIDRFMLKVKVGYPTRNDEREVIARQLNPSPPEVRTVVDMEQLLNARKTIAEIYLDEKVKEYVLDIVFATREPSKVKGLAEFGRFIQFGASPRASIWLAKAARAHAFLKHRGYVIPEDIKAIAPDILRHRIITTYEAEAEEITSDAIVSRILEAVEVP